MQNEKWAGTEKEEEEKKHEKSIAPASVRRSPIQALTGLALLNFIEKNRAQLFKANDVVS